MAGPNTCAENWTISGLKPTDPLPQFGWSCIYHNSKSKILKLQGRNKKKRLEKCIFKTSKDVPMEKLPLAPILVTPEVNFPRLTWNE